MQLRTTVNEVISALIKEEKSPDIRNWVIVESWRGIERPLPPKTRLLKGKKYSVRTVLIGKKYSVRTVLIGPIEDENIKILLKIKIWQTKKKLG